MANTKPKALSLIAPRFREEFLHFTETGQASPEFLDYLNTDENCQKALEMDFAERSAGLREGISLIRKRVIEEAQKPGCCATAGAPHNTGHYD